MVTGQGMTPGLAAVAEGRRVVRESGLPQAVVQGHISQQRKQLWLLRVQKASDLIRSMKPLWNEHVLIYWIDKDGKQTVVFVVGM